MRKTKQKKNNDYQLLKVKLIFKTILLFFGAALLLFTVYDLVFYHRFAEAVVGIMDRLIFHDRDAAMEAYQLFFRNFYDLFIILAFVLTFAIGLAIYLKFFTKYFNEIDQGIDTLIDRSKEASMSAELYPISEKINRIRNELEVKEQEAQEANRRKDDLVMYLAHDIRTPLTSVIGYLDLLEEAPDMPAAQRIKYTRIALDKADRLEKMVNEFFEITRFNAQQTELQKENIDLSYMLMQLTDELTPVLEANGNTVHVDAADDLTVYGDPDKLARVFNNVLKNAASYSTPNTEIQISAKEVENGVRITFQNAGKTIPAEKLASLFDRFYRADEARTSQTGGTGLGLAIAKEIVTLHGGTITASSINDTITFTITLPLGKSLTGEKYQ